MRNYDVLVIHNMAKSEEKLYSLVILLWFLPCSILHVLSNSMHELQLWTMTSLICSNSERLWHKGFCWKEEEILKNKINNILLIRNHILWFFTDNKSNGIISTTKCLAYYMNSKISNQAEFFFFLVRNFDKTHSWLHFNQLLCCCWMVS